MGSHDLAAIRTGARLTRILVAGALISLVLVGLTGVVSTRQLLALEGAMLDKAGQGARTSFLLGDIAEQLARLRASVVTAVHRPPDQREGYELSARYAQVALHQSQAEILTTVQPAQRAMLDGLLRDVGFLEQDLLDALSMAERGRTEEARQSLDAHADFVVEVHDALDRMDQGNERLEAADLARLEGRVHRVTQIEGVIGGLLLLALATTWGLVHRAVQRQNRLLAEYSARIESTNQDLDAFAGRVAHDLRNALTPITLQAETVRRCAEDPERVRATATRLERSCRKATTVIDGLLAFSRATGRSNESPRCTSVRSVVEGALDELEPEALRLGVKVTLDVPSDLYVQCDEGLFHLIIANLCGNAVKFLGERADRQVHISARSDGPWCELSVSDTGPGIPREAQARIFEPFFRVDGARAPGSGIGLATVHRVVDAHGGTVAVDSALGKGSAFRVRLPLADRALDEARAPH